MEKEKTKLSKKNTNMVDVSKKTNVVQNPKNIKKENIKKELIKEKTNNRKKFYFSFEMRVISFFILFIFLLLVGIVFFVSATKITHKEKLSYDEKGNIDYTVCLKQNDFYEDKCISNNMTYVASLINNINLTYNYSLNINKDILAKNNFEYEVTAKLVIQNNEDMTSFYEKDYTILSRNKNDLLKKDNKVIINKSFDIDYNYYNNIATSFKSQYGVDSVSYLEVYFNVYNDINNQYNIPNASASSIKIPLSQKSIQIKIDSKEANNRDNKVVYTNEFSITNLIYIVLSIISLLLSTVPLIKVIRLMSKLGSNQTNYDKFISKILKEYDRLVAETRSLPSFDKYNVMKISSFEELLDVRDNLKLPIMYYNVTAHQKAYFYIVYGDNLYLYTVKSIDISEK